MKKKKMKFFMSLSVLLIVFLISTSSLNMFNTQALLEENKPPYSIDSFDRFTWEWTTTEVVSAESTAESVYSSLVVDSAGNTHIVWEDVTDYDSAGTDRDIFYKCWNSTSSSWTTTEVVSSGFSGDSFTPSLAVDSAGNIHVAWESVDVGGTLNEHEISYKRWNASSQTWTTTELVSTESINYFSGHPSLAVDSTGNVHIVWEDETDYDSAGTDRDIFYKSWDAATFSWTTTEVVSTESSEWSDRPSLAVDSSCTVYVAWHDMTDYDSAGSDWDIFYKRWDVDYSWTTTEVVSTESTSSSFDSSLAIDSVGTVHVVWGDVTDYDSAGSDWDIFYKRWDVDYSWTTTEVVSTESSGTSGHPSLAVDSAGTVHIAWRDVTDYAGSGTDYDIFYKHWNFASYKWIITEVVSPESTGSSYNPSLAVDSAGIVHVAWYDNADFAGSGTDYDIFYKKFTGPPVAPELAFIVLNPTELTTIYLDWNNVLRATTFYVYRSTAYIWSVEGLVPINTVSSSEYIDTVPTEGFYYYVIVAENSAGNSSHSNCQYVEVKFPDLEAPELSPILPNPTEISSISLVWDNVEGAIEYYIYRSTSYIWSVEGLTPIATVVLTSYVDTLPSEGIYLYVIVTNDGLRNSTHSNCEYVEYKLPTLNEFFVTFGILGGIAVILITTINLRKRKNEQIN